MTNNRTWTCFVPEETAEGSDESGPLRTWPPALAALVAKYRASELDGKMLIPSEHQAEADEVMRIFASEYGVAPRSWKLPRIEKGNEDHHPFYFMLLGSQTLRLRPEINFESQLECGNPIPEGCENEGMGCANGKRQILNFSVERATRTPSADLFNLYPGPRLPIGTIFGISGRLRRELEESGMVGFTVRSILNEKGDPTDVSQLTVTATSKESISARGRLRGAKSCEICRHEFGLLSDILLGRPLPLRLFSDVDIQATDRWSVGGQEVKLEFGTRLVVSGKFVKLLISGKFTGTVRACRQFAFEPVVIEPQ